MDSSLTSQDPPKPKKSSLSTPPNHSWVLPYKTRSLECVYTIGKKLDQGQFGTTYLCTKKSTGHLYACKTIPKKKLICKEDYEDVWREIQIMHHLSEHPIVVRIKGTYEDSLYVHIVMELCAGGELFDRIVERGQYSEKEAAKLIKTFVAVVEACHSLGVLHRDLKPENFLFLSSQENAALKATDFGLSISISQTDQGCIISEPEVIIDRRMVPKRGKAFTRVLVKWFHSAVEDSTWEDLSDFQSKFPLFNL